MHKILIELVLTNSCNKRCEYCDLDFKNKALSKNELDIVINFLSKNTADYIINFFGWEPLLYYKNIKFFVEKTKNIVSKYTIWTNWVLLDKEKLDFFKTNSVEINLSIDNISALKDIKIDIISTYKEITNINFIVDPDYIKTSKILFKEILKYDFQNINIMPVFTTKNWDNDSLWELKKLKKYFDSFKIPNLKYFSYYNWVSVDKQFILDTDLNLYADLDSLLWLQKQYKIISNKLRNTIHEHTKIWNVKDLNLLDLINNYNIKNILKIALNIPKEIWTLKQNTIIDKILKNGT